MGRNSTSRKRLVLPLLLLVCAPPTIADHETESVNPFFPAGVTDSEWRFIRGPTYGGHSPEINLADQWPSQGPPVLWTRELGQGYSALVVSQDRVFTQYQTLGGQYLICLDADQAK